MTKIIAFLEDFGASATLRHASHEELQVVLDQSLIDPLGQSAILRGDGERLEALLGAPVITCCSITPGEDDDDEEEPSREDEEISMHASVRCIATAV